MPLTRRYFLKSAGLSLFGVGFVPSFLRRTAFAMDHKIGGGRKVLIAIFQRGAVDGLNMVIPYGEQSYYHMRPTIAIPRPSSNGAGDASRAGIDLDGFFAFHPSLAPLQPLFKSKQLAVIHAAGSPSNSRSHFDAQDYMETATPDNKSTNTGWLNRYLLANPEAESTPFRAVAIDPRMPMTLQGAARAFVVNDLRAYRLMGRPTIPVTPAGEENAFREMYASTQDPLLRSNAHETFAAIRTLKSIGVEKYQPAHGAIYPKGQLGHSLRQIAQLIKADVGLEVAFADVGGWDNHVNEGGVDGQMAANLRQFGSALAAFSKDMGDRMANVVVMTMSEFGRTARENGNRGTDHGHANAMLVMGGPVKGGKVYGKWPGLKRGELNQDRDLALTTDFRDVFAEAVVRHLGARKTSVIFPGFQVSPERFRGFLG